MNYLNHQQDQDQDQDQDHQDYQTINIFRGNLDDDDSIYTPQEFQLQYEERYIPIGSLECYDKNFNKKYVNSIYTNSIYTNSIYSDIKSESDEKTENGYEKEEKIISDIISFYTNEPIVSELIPLPISPENLEKLKNQWNKEDKFSMKINEKGKTEKTVWKRISDSFKKQSSPKRSLYDILTK